MKKKLIVIVILIIASISIGIGIYMNKISQSKNIMAISIDLFKNKIDNYIKLPNDLVVGDNFNIDGKIDFNLDTEYYKDSTLEEDKKVYNTIKNLNNLDSTFSIKQNAKDSEGLLTINSSFEKEKLIDYKYYVKDATKYYYMDGVVDKYIDDGTCNYFENINSTHTTKANIDYLYNFIYKSMKNNLKEEYFTKNIVDESINNKKTNVYKISITLDNKNIKEIINGVISDISKDKRSSEILDNIGVNIKNIKLKDDKDILLKDEKYVIDVYATKILYKPLKFEITHINNNIKNKYIYEGNENSGVFYYLDNDQVKYKINITTKSNNIFGKMYDSSNKKIGEIRIDKTGYNLNINYSYKYNDKEYELVYSSKYSDISKKKSYSNDKLLSFKYIKDDKVVVNGDISIKLKVDSKVKIEEDITDVVLRKNLSEKEKESFDTKLDSIKKRLEK